MWYLEHTRFLKSVQKSNSTRYSVFLFLLLANAAPRHEIIYNLSHIRHQMRRSQFQSSDAASTLYGSVTAEFQLSGQKNVQRG